MKKKAVIIQEKKKFYVNTLEDILNSVQLPLKRP